MYIILLMKVRCKIINIRVAHIRLSYNTLIGTDISVFILSLDSHTHIHTEGGEVHHAQVLLRHKNCF